MKHSDVDPFIDVVDPMTPTKTTTIARFSTVTTKMRQGGIMLALKCM